MSGLLGVGGGIVNVPTMNVLMRVPIRVATATSTYMLGATASAGALLYLAAVRSHRCSPQRWWWACSRAPRSAARFSRRLPRELLSALFVIVAAIFSVQMLLRFFIGS